MYYFFNNIAILDDGGMQMRQQFIELIPIPCIEKTTRQKIIDIVNNLNNSKNEELENLLNDIVYKIYEFSSTEIKQIKHYIREKISLIKE